MGPFPTAIVATTTPLPDPGQRTKATAGATSRSLPIARHRGPAYRPDVPLEVVAPIGVTVSKVHDLDRTSTFHLDIWSGTAAQLPAALTSRPAIVKEGCFATESPCAVLGPGFHSHHLGGAHRAGEGPHLSAVRRLDSRLRDRPRRQPPL